MLLSQQCLRAGAKEIPLLAMHDSSVQVVDCGSVIAHIFQGEEARMQYNLEKLWADPASRESERQADSSYAL